MKYLLIFALLMAGCKDDTIPTKGTNHYWGDGQIRIIEFEGCEYVTFGSGHGTFGAHKGNCKNKIHYNDSKRSEGLYSVPDSSRGSSVEVTGR